VPFDFSDEGTIATIFGSDPPVDPDVVPVVLDDVVLAVVDRPDGGVLPDVLVVLLLLLPQPAIATPQASSGIRHFQVRIQPPKAVRSASSIGDPRT
jgi:hypothetical protein